MNTATPSPSWTRAGALSLPVVLTVSLLALTACGGGGDDGEQPPPNTTITAAGGTVASSDGQARLVVPAGAATEAVSVTLNPAPNATLPEDVTILPGTVFELAGNGGPLVADAELTITVPESALQKALTPQGTVQPQGLFGPLTPCVPYDVDGDGDIDFMDALALAFEAAMSGGTIDCYGPPKIGKITPTAILALPDCANNGLDIKCTIKDLSPGKFGVLFDKFPPALAVERSKESVTAPGGVIVSARAQDNKSVKRVDLIEQKIVGNTVVSQSMVATTVAPDAPPASPLLSAGTTRQFTSAADNATYRYRAWAIDGNGNQTLLTPLGNENDVVVNIPIEPAPDSTPPTISLVASAATVPVGQTVTLTATASDDVGVTLVEFFKNANKIGEDATAPYELTTVAFTGADLGTQTFTATAKDAANNSGTSNSVPVTVVDEAAPSISLAASATNVTVGDTVTLTATAGDNVGVTLVEFYRNGGKIGEDATAPYEFTTPAFGAADIGVQSFTAKATDAAQLTATSNAVNVTVSPVAALEAYVNPATGLDTNAGTSGAPFKTLNKAFTTVGAGGTVWLQDGSYTTTTEGVANTFTGRTVPAGVAIKAVNAGAATIGFTLQFPGGGSITGVDFDASSSGRILTSGGTTLISGPRWTKLGVVTSGNGIEASGTAKVLVDPNGVATHNYVLTPGALTGFALVTDTAELTVNGGVLDGTTGQARAFTLDGSAKLTLANFKLTNTTTTWVGGDAALYISGAGNPGNEVRLTNTLIDLSPSIYGACLMQERTVGGAIVGSYIELKNSKLLKCNGGGMQIREGFATIQLVNSEISGTGRFGIEAGQIGTDTATVKFGYPGIVLNNSTIKDNFLGGVSINKGGAIAIAGGTIAGGNNAGIRLLNDEPNQLTARNATISGSDALVLQGAYSAFGLDLGRKDNPGGNTIIGTTTGMRVSVNADVMIYAVGNTWKANEQGADANGHYSISSSVCGNTNPCDVSSGSGANFTFFNAGAGVNLRLADQ